MGINIRTAQSNSGMILFAALLLTCFSSMLGGFLLLQTIMQQRIVHNYLQSNLVLRRLEQDLKKIINNQQPETSIVTIVASNISEDGAKITDLIITDKQLIKCELYATIRRSRIQQAIVIRWHY